MITELDDTFLDPRDLFNGQHCSKDTPRYHNGISHIKYLFDIFDGLLILELCDDLDFIYLTSLFLDLLVLLSYHPF